MGLFPQNIPASFRNGNRRCVNGDVRVPIAGDYDRSGMGYGDSGSAARFFYCAKASRAEREAGLEGMDEKLYARSGGAQGAESRGNSEYLQHPIGLNRISKVRNHHPTVKPLSLMRYLTRLVTPPNGLILDPFMGSGTTGMAAKAEEFRFVGIEINKEYCEIAEKRIGAMEAMI